MPRHNTQSGTETGYAVEVSRDVRIPTADRQVSLAANLYRPVTKAPVPLLLTVTPYRKDYIGGSANELPARWFAGRGYATLLVDIAGTGSSDGVRRPEFDAGEADDALAAIEWATRQPWCDGSVGMWGHSYAAVSTLRTASRRPAALRAIIALMHGLNPGTDTVHPDGARGDLHALANRGTAMLVGQLLPPLDNDHSPDAQRRWRRRLAETEPVLLDFARNGPASPVWLDRAVAGEAITVPALCIGGWRDMFPDALIGAYERLAGPKKLIVGPWGHVLPQHAAVEPIDFLTLALDWWEHWLRGRDSAIVRTPAVTLYQEGDNPHWQAFESWPPTGDRLVLSTGEDSTLRSPGPGPGQGKAGQPIAEYRPDPTIGALRGLPGLGLGEQLRPEDQHDDDMRSMIATSAPWPVGVVIAGRPEVVLTHSGGRHRGRLSVRLTEVDANGRSSLITAGVLRPAAAEWRHQITLRPILYRVRAGSRLRVAISDSDFPRLTPLSTLVPFRVSGIELILPVATGALDRTVAMPSLRIDRTESPIVAGDARWTVARDLLGEGIEVSVRAAGSGLTPGTEHDYHISSELSAAVKRAAPERALTTGSHTASVRLRSGTAITATAEVRVTSELLWVRGQLTIDGAVVFARSWTSRFDTAKPADGPLEQRATVDLRAASAGQLAAIGEPIIELNCTARMSRSRVASSSPNREPG